MSDTFKKILVLIITVFSAWMIYCGAVLPFKKSQLHVNAVYDLQRGKVNSIGDFNSLFDPVLDFYSPIGQNETVQYYLGILIGIINQQSEKPVVDALVKQAENRMEPILNNGGGFSFNQNLYSLGSIYKIAAFKFHEKYYYDKAVSIFQKGLEYSPDRLIFLKGLFDLYSINIDAQDKAVEVGKIILEYYPNEESVKETLEKLK